MLSIFEEIVRRVAAGERVGLCTLVRARGSTPQGTGAKMLVTMGGGIVGTLGGGCVEAEVRTRAMELMGKGESKLLTFKLDHDYGWDDGLICGGTMDVYVEVLEEVKGYGKLAEEIRAGREAVMEVAYEGGVYREVILPTARLVIAGGGHVGKELAKIAAGLDFWVTVIDDRAEYVSEERFPLARQRVVGEIEVELERMEVTPQTYVVIVTRGHRHDGKALAKVVGRGAKYVGLIGSKRKVRVILDDLLAQGMKREELNKVHAPIGLAIGAVTVGEIAVSIAAELVAVRRGLGGKVVGPMKMDG